MTAILRDASGKMHHGMLFAPPLCSTRIINNSAMYQLVMCRFLEIFAHIMYIPSGVIFYHAVKPNEKFGLLLL